MNADAAVMDASGEGKPTFLVFSDDWGEHMSSSQHLFRHIAREHAVVWVNTVGMRAPKLSSSDLVKVWRKLSRMCRSDRRRTRVDEDLQLTVCQPFMVPYSGIGAVRAFNARSVARTLRRILKAGSNSSRTIVVATVPNAGDYCGAFSNATVVYYCVDDFTQWPGMDVEVVRDMERRLIARADVLVAASEKLRERLSDAGKTAHLLTHGVDVDLFSKVAAAEHSSLQKINKPRVGFFGLIDERVDQSLLDQIAHRMPDVSFVLAGPVAQSVRKIAKHPNIHFIGVIPYLELPEFVRGVEVLFIPYRIGGLGDFLAPLKLKEYVATGKPIVSASIASASAYGRPVTIARDVEDWDLALRSGISAGSLQQKEGAIASEVVGSWRHKARELVNLCVHNPSGWS